MARINEHYAKLPASYLFPEIGRRVRAYQTANPDAKVIRLGIGDVTEPLAPAIVEAMHAAVDEMGKRETFRGYGPEQGYDFLIEAIREHNAANADAPAWFIDVIGDKSADYSDVLLSSALFDYSRIYEQMVKDIEAGTKTNTRFRTDEKIERAYVEQREMQYLYQEGENYVFMDKENFEPL